VDNKKMGQLEKAMVREKLKPKSKDAYRAWASRFLSFSKAAKPDEQSAISYIKHLESLGSYAFSSLRQAEQALRFYLKHVERKQISFGRQAPKELKAPMIIEGISPAEFKKMMLFLDHPVKLMSQLIYGSGLTPEQVLNLRVGDILLEKGQINLKDHVTVLPKSIHGQVVERIDYATAIFEQDKAGGIWPQTESEAKRITVKQAFLFPSLRPQFNHKNKTRRPVDLATLQRPLKMVSTKVLGRTITPRMLRYAFAFALFDQQYDKAIIQQVMGYNSGDSISRIQQNWQRAKRKTYLPISPLDKDW